MIQTVIVFNFVVSSSCFPFVSHNVLLVSGEGWLIGAAAQGDAGAGQTNVVTPVVNTILIVVIITN